MSRSKKSCNYLKCLIQYGSKAVNLIEKFFPPLLLLAMRLWIAKIFFFSGLTKISNMDTAVLLFEYEYALPFINPVFAAYSATAFELLCPILIVAGFATRLAVLPLIGMSLVIQLFVFQNTEHFYWLFLLTTLLTYGAGKLSIDRFIKVR